MKKNTMIAIAAALSNIDFENKDAILAELDADINRGAEQKAAKDAEYTAVHDIIIGALSDTPVTIAELYDAVKDELPDGFGRGRVQYGVTKLWASEVVKIEGKPNTYKRA